ncbi:MULTISPECIES: fimbria/pilus chaperone family protein [Providencia]|uniref:Beta-fimbriae chaperone protein n=1 Tax=Providencia heimbachae ATCC 35613 TaxID=1354272 RepID=A0A1B7JKK4_9GAMM|nr:MULTISPECIES: fimbria/pilus chaperone family protein [Providencia]MBP6121728.1 fimbria/pilus periplasmic chaperone [Providencia sp.]NIH22028.1 fimbria/pilus periplasmic chaperone [Providencia heimbachae]OAT48415.1 beta-fimbriae chaperone protein [Providencia heimbachae ATCC 35613]QCJ71966.1 fimbrial protein [Providencia heimbachae]SQH12582.1 putative fimbrial chaperone protein [Providencia heimbachae]
MKKIISTITLFLIVLASFSAKASFQLETMTVILDAGETRKVFNVKNTTKEPILLSTKVSDLDGSKPMAKDIMVSPPIIRIEPNESQQINFVLKQGIDLKQEEILKVSFQGVGASKKNSAKMPIRQDIAMLISPANLSVNQKPWDNVSASQKNNELTLQNKSDQVVRLSPSVTALPSEEVYSIGQFYLRPNESKTIEVKGTVQEVTFSPLSRYGFKLAENKTIKVSMNK